MDHCIKIPYGHSFHSSFFSYLSEIFMFSCSILLTVPWVMPPTSPNPSSKTLIPVLWVPWNPKYCLWPRGLSSGLGRRKTASANQSKGLEVAAARAGNGAMACIPASEENSAVGFWWEDLWWASQGLRDCERRWAARIARLVLLLFVTELDECDAKVFAIYFRTCY